jgi:hypothetical protein
MPFWPRREAIRARYGRWNMPITAMTTGAQRFPSHTRHLRIGGETRIPMLKSQVISSGALARRAWTDF